MKHKKPFVRIINFIITSVYHGSLNTESSLCDETFDAFYSNKLTKNEFKYGTNLYIHILHLQSHTMP